MKIFSVNLNSDNKNAYKTVFTGFNFNLGKPRAPKEMDDLISKTSLNLFKQMNDLIEKTWTGIKKDGLDKSALKYITSSNRDGLIELRPIYNGKNSLLMEVEKDGVIEQLIFDRAHPSEFRYEKLVKTLTGSATTKSYDSKLNRDPLIENRTDYLIESYFPRFVTDNKILRKY